MSILDVIERRHSIRKFKTAAIADEMLFKILLAAQLAPSWRNQQCWRFIILRDQKIKSKVIRCTSVFNQSWLGKEPIMIVACGDPELSGSRNGQPYYLVDVAIAMEHIVLAATDMGLGACWIGGFEEEPIKKILNIPENIRVVALSPLGYPDEKEGIVSIIAKKVVSSKNRNTINSFVYNDQWSKKQV